MNTLGNSRAITSPSLEGKCLFRKSTFSPAGPCSAALRQPVAGRLRSAGLTVTSGVGGYGVVGVLEGAHPGRTVAYRATRRAPPPRRTVRRCPGELPAEPFPAMVCPEKEGHALERHLRRVLGPDAVTVLHAAVPFSGEDYALFLDRIPGTYCFLGVRAPGADITTCYPHLGGFDPDERAIGVGVRAMAGWLAKRLG